jgi:hypothetical protein
MAWALVKISDSHLKNVTPFQFVKIHQFKDKLFHALHLGQTLKNLARRLFDFNQPGTW